VNDASPKNSIEQLLAAGLARLPDPVGGLVVTLDGRIVGARVVRGDWSADRMAAIASTLLSVTKAAVRELGGARSDEVQIGFDQGTITLARLSDERHGLCLIAGPKCPLGILVSSSRRLREEISNALGAMADLPANQGSSR
jgi:predicted regulator of Ras-like GTPase activity (Roadblock/LC7/MglB family)